LDKSFSKYLFSKAKITCLEKTSFELTVAAEMFLKIKLQYLKIQIPVKQKFEIFYRILGEPRLKMSCIY